LRNQAERSFERVVEKMRASGLLFEPVELEDFDREVGDSNFTKLVLRFRAEGRVDEEFEQMLKVYYRNVGKAKSCIMADIVIFIFFLVYLRTA
jgi:hypothetical protein